MRLIRLKNFNLDDRGCIFEFDGRIFRGIYEHRKDLILEILNGGLLEELVKRGLFVPTRVSDLKLDDYALVLEHERVDPIIYPYEWTFSMLKSAALMVLDIFEVAKKYGFYPLDCHAYNVGFKGGKPVFLDLGSFFKTNAKEDDCLLSNFIRNFSRSYYFPLFLWSRGIVDLVRFNFYRGFYHSYREYLLLREGLSSGFRIDEALSRLMFKGLKEIALFIANLGYDESPIGDFNVKKGYAPLISGLKILFKHSGLNLVCLKGLREEIENLKVNFKTRWEDYYGPAPKLTPRFSRILSLVKDLCRDAETAISFGANACFFENALLDMTHIKRVICQDADFNALDAGFNRYGHRSDGKEIFFACYDFLKPLLPITRVKSPYKRFKSDLVIALALTHHLILREGCSMDFILKEFRKYTNKFAFIEFMPLGLWSPGSEVRVPPWYTRDNFRNSFCKYFDFLLEEQLEENRILFIGKVK